MTKNFEELRKPIMDDPVRARRVNAEVRRLSDEMADLEQIQKIITDKEVTYVLYGVADRDPNELVCMFFDNTEDRETFATDLPGRYRKLMLVGVNYNNIKKVQAEGEN